MNRPSVSELGFLNEAIDRVRAELGRLDRAMVSLRARMFGPAGPPEPGLTGPAQNGPSSVPLAITNPIAAALGPMPNGPATQVDAATLAAKVDEVAAAMTKPTPEVFAAAAARIEASRTIGAAWITEGDLDAFLDVAQKAIASRAAFRAYMDAPYSGAVLTNPDLTPFARASNDADEALDDAIAAVGALAGPLAFADDGVAP